MLRRCEYGKKGVRFCEQTSHSSEGDNVGLDQKLQPQDAFVGLFNNDSDLGDELSLRTGAADGSIIGCDCRATTQQLPSEDAGYITLRQGLEQPDNADGELLAVLLEFFRLTSAPLHPCTSMSQ
jgi:hypothetical protein